MLSSLLQRSQKVEQANVVAYKKYLQNRCYQNNKISKIQEAMQQVVGLRAKPEHRWHTYKPILHVTRMRHLMHISSRFQHIATCLDVYNGTFNHVLRNTPTATVKWMLLFIETSTGKTGTGKFPRIFRVLSHIRQPSIACHDSTTTNIQTRLPLALRNVNNCEWFTYKAKNTQGVNAINAFKNMCNHNVIIPLHNNKWSYLEPNKSKMVVFVWCVTRSWMPVFVANKLRIIGEWRILANLVNNVRW